MYEARFGTDWDDLDLEAAITRAFALGVHAGVDRPLPAEYERVRSTADTTYERTMIEVSFAEGKRDASETARAPETVWTELVVDDPVAPTDRGTEAPLTRAITRVLERPDHSVTATDLPALLERD